MQTDFENDLVSASLSDYYHRYIQAANTNMKQPQMYLEPC